MREERLFSTEVFVLVTQNQGKLFLYLELVRKSRILKKNVSLFINANFLFFLENFFNLETQNLSETCSHD